MGSHRIRHPCYALISESCVSPSECCSTNASNWSRIVHGDYCFAQAPANIRRKGSPVVETIIPVEHHCETVEISTCEQRTRTRYPVQMILTEGEFKFARKTFSPFVAGGRTSEPPRIKICMCANATSACQVGHSCALASKKSCTTMYIRIETIRPDHTREEHDQKGNAHDQKPATHKLNRHTSNLTKRIGMSAKVPNSCQTTIRCSDQR
jgi:hypothetical protein